MLELIQCIVTIVIVLGIKFVCDWLPDMRFNNYTPPEGHSIDYNAQALDRIQNHLSNDQVKHNTVCGKYTVKKDK